MKQMIQERKSIAFKLAVMFGIVIVIQIVLIAALLIFGGVFKQTEEKSFQFFSEKVSHRKSSLENEMNNVWTNFDQYMEKISQYYSLYGRDQSTDEFLTNIAPFMQDALGVTKTTGIFFIMNDDNESDDSRHPVVYLRNADPTRGVTDKANLSLIAGPWEIAKEMRITTSRNWDLRLDLTRENRDFYDKVYENRHLSDNERLLGYWCPPFKLTNDDEKIITYSLPLNDEKGNLIGVFGVEISLNYLYKFLPPSDLQAQDSYGYLIGMRKDSDSEIYPVAARAVLQSHVLDLDSTIALDKVSSDYQIYKLNEARDGKRVYASVRKMGMYYSNTPHESDEWFLIGLMDGHELLQLPNRVFQLLVMAFCICIVSGLFISVILSRRFARPIIDLSEQVNHNETEHFIPTGFLEIDQLSDAILHSQKRLIDLSNKLSRIIELTGVPFGAYEINRNSNDVFVTNYLARLFRLTEPTAVELFADKQKFTAYLDEICSNSTEEENIYAVNGGLDTFYLRVTQAETEEAVLGVVMDVTEEVVHSKELKEQRDKDPLTGILNRYAFKRDVAYYNSHLNEVMPIGIGLFDLNGLKVVNDQWGHEKGDQYLKLSSDIICGTFVDTTIYRIGGDEFVTIFFNRSKADIDKLHKSLVEKMDSYNKYGDFNIGIAFGYSFYDEARDSCMEEVLARADHNMYIDKREMKGLEPRETDPIREW